VIIVDKNSRRNITTTLILAGDSQLAFDRSSVGFVSGIETLSMSEAPESVLS